MTDYFKLKPVKPHYAEGLYFSKRLEQLSLKMSNSMEEIIKKHYEAEESRITGMAQDARPSTLFKSLINKNMSYWRSLFNKLAPDLSKEFVNKIDNNVQRDLIDGIKPLGRSDLVKSLSIKVKADTQSLLDKKQASIQTNVGLIKSIPQQYQKDITYHVNEALTHGRDWKYLSEKIYDLGYSTKKRSKLIAKDQLVKGTNVLKNARMLNAGIEEAEWNHSGGDKVPRPSHVAADGKTYKVSEGCLIDGKYLQPGEEPGCTCFSTPKIKLS